ncbi:MAG: rhodanese-related sulfurtransferase [Chloroflexota bacterium]
MTQFTIVTFYKFVELTDFAERRAVLKAFCVERGIRGSILLAQEGINATVAGEETAVNQLLTHLRSDPAFADLEHKTSYSDFNPFRRMKVRLKREIVNMQVPNVDPREQVGTYVAPKDWNELISDPDVLVIDTRNDFEVKIGSFMGAVDPNTKSFHEFPDYVEAELGDRKHKKVAMFCTGGIRCEKATSFMVSQGFEQVFHLQGGILKYLEDVPAEESLWEGECFVFDGRVTVDQHLQKGTAEQCPACQQMLTPEEREQEAYQEGVCCPYCYDRLDPERKELLMKRQQQREIELMRNA